MECWEKQTRVPFLFPVHRKLLKGFLIYSDGGNTFPVLSWSILIHFVYKALVFDLCRISLLAFSRFLRRVLIGIHRWVGKRKLSPLRRRLPFMANTRRHQPKTNVQGPIMVSTRVILGRGFIWSSNGVTSLSFIQVFRHPCSMSSRHLNAWEFSMYSGQRGNRNTEEMVDLRVDRMCRSNMRGSSNQVHILIRSRRVRVTRLGKVISLIIKPTRIGGYDRGLPPSMVVLDQTCAWSVC